VLAFVRVDAAQNTADITLRMEEAIRLLPEVTSCHYISGAGTFELQVVARDLESFSGLCAMCCCACPTSKTCTRFFAGRSEVQQRAAAAQHAGRPWVPPPRPQLKSEACTACISDTGSIYIEILVHQALKAHL
jgi:hypothetical protein